MSQCTAQRVSHPMLQPLHCEVLSNKGRCYGGYWLVDYAVKQCLCKSSTGRLTWQTF